MKRIFICFLLVMVGTNTFSQQTDSTQSSRRQMYMTKSRNQKTAARVLLWGGIALMGVGTLIMVNSQDDDSLNDSFGSLAAGGFIGSIGFISSIVSIPVFRASARNKEQAMTFSTGLNIQRSFFPVQTGLVLHSMPALSLRLNF